MPQNLLDHLAVVNRRDQVRPTAALGADEHILGAITVKSITEVAPTE